VAIVRMYTWQILPAGTANLSRMPSSSIGGKALPPFSHPIDQQLKKKSRHVPTVPAFFPEL